MFDAKSILEALVRGAAPQQATSPAGGGGLGDILGQLTKMAQQGSAANAPAQASTGGMGGLGDILGKLGGAAGAGGGGLGDILGKLGQAAGGAASSAGGSAGGLGDILGKLQQAAAGAGGAAGGGNLMDILKQVMNQATDGVREGACKIGAATGATDALGRATAGMSSDDALAKLKDLIAQHQLEAGAAAGGLGAVVLGTRAGRSVAASAVKIGALALIGGLAYKALLNYQNGQPLITAAHTVAEAAPAGSGFEPAAVTNESALLYIKTMIAAAAADGRIDEAEMGRIMGAEKQGGLGANAEEFLANEANNPASIDELAEACESPEQAVQVYTAARLAVTPDGGAEDAFLAALAAKLGIDAKLAAHIDAAAKSAA